MSVRIGVDSSKEMGETQKLFHLAKIKSFISSLTSASAKLTAIESYWKSLSAVLYIGSGICWISKSKS